MGANADRFAANCRPDKLRFMFRDTEEAGKELYPEVFTAVQAMTGWSDSYTARHVKYQRIAPTKQGMTERAVIQLTYKAAEICYSLSLRWLVAVVEVEMKAYLEEQDADSFGRFIDTLQDTTGRLNTYVYSNGAHAAGRKGAKRKSATMGSKKADQNVKCYKREKERPGLEVAVRGKKVKAIAADVVNYQTDSDTPIPPRALWNIFLARCARVGFIHLAQELTRRGIDLFDFFTAFTFVEDENAPRDPGDEFNIAPGGEGGWTRS